MLKLGDERGVGRAAGCEQQVPGALGGGIGRAVQGGGKRTLNDGGAGGGKLLQKEPLLPYQRLFVLDTGIVGRQGKPIAELVLAGWAAQDLLEGVLDHGAAALLLR